MFVNMGPVLHWCVDVSLDMIQTRLYEPAFNVSADIKTHMHILELSRTKG